DRPRIQEALDRIAQLPADEQGFRGALLLKRGTYRVSDSLRIGESGLVLRGEGDGADGTVLLATGRKPYALVAVSGRSGAREVAGTRQAVVDVYVPVGARRLSVGDGSKFRVGQGILVTRRGNAAWIHALGMDRITPRPDDPG